jgi:erythrin-vacuolar iron transport family protein
MRSFESLSENELLALAIWQEEEDSRVYDQFVAHLEKTYPASAEIFKRMRHEEQEHCRRLTEMYHQKFGQHIPLIRRTDVRGFLRRRPIWLATTLGLERMRKHASMMEAENGRFYEKAAVRATDPAVRQLLTDLAAEERGHVTLADQTQSELLTPQVRKSEDEATRRLFLLQIVQPGLAGLMDGSVSTLAPLFAAAFATHSSPETFRIGLAASVGAGISMGFAEALSDDGHLTGRGRPLLRGGVCGLMTACGGLGHTMPYLIQNYKHATIVATFVVGIELAIISWIRNRFMDTPLLAAAFQVMVGGALVFLAGILIGNS